jgi:uncharacterized protein YjbI with pentapeptide repeats
VNLSWANLGKVNLSWANLRRADLDDIIVNWQSHDLIAEFLRREAGDNIEQMKIAGLLLVCRDKCWDWFLSQDDSHKAWALSVLRKYVKNSDGAPDCLTSGESSAAAGCLLPTNTLLQPV